MSLFDCIQTAVNAGEMDKTRGQQAQELFNSIRRAYAGDMGEEAANAAAAEDVKRIMRERSFEKRRRARIQLQTARRLTRDLLQHRKLDGTADPGDALPGLLEKAGTKFPSVRETREALRGRYHRIAIDGLRHFGRNIVGEIRNKADLANVVRALHGETVNDASATELARAFGDAMKQARKDYNAAGGNIRELADWGLPHAHSRERLLDAGYVEWRKFLVDNNAIDWSRIIDRDTGQPFAVTPGAPPSGRAEILLREIYDGITTSGWDTRKPSFRVQGLSVANKRDAARILHFTNADAWLKYNERFGLADPFTAIVSHLDGMARDTALMRVLGPNPKAGLEYAIQVAEKQAQTQPWKVSRRFRHPVEKVRRDAHISRVMLGLTTGEANRPVDGWLARFLSGTRHVLVSAQLGGATLSAVSDAGFRQAAAREVGFNPISLEARVISEIAKGRDQQQALRMGVIAEELGNVGAAQARYVGEDFAPEIATRLSDATLRLSGLSRWTEAGRHGFQLEFMGFLADHNAHAWADLPDPLRNTLDRHGITPEEWSVIQKTPLHRTPEGASFLIPDDIRFRNDIPENVSDALALKVMGMITSEMEFAVPTATLRGRATFLGGTQPGTFAGELLRSGLMYKSFGLSVIFNQSRRIMEQGSTFSRLAYAGQMFAVLTLMGALSIQLKELAKGRDPRPVNSRAFLGAAILQGGGLGIFGDFFQAAENRFGGGFGETLSGPVSGIAGDVAALGVNLGRAALGDENTHAGRQTVDFLRRYTPGASLWYLSLAAQRWGFDNLAAALDPEAQLAFRNRERRRMNTWGNSSWWEPGQAAPSRGPEFGRLVQ